MPLLLVLSVILLLGALKAAGQVIINSAYVEGPNEWEQLTLTVVPSYVEVGGSRYIVFTVIAAGLPDEDVVCIWAGNTHRGPANTAQRSAQQVVSSTLGSAVTRTCDWLSLQGVYSMQYSTLAMLIAYIA
jgi:hypothetical protein